MSVTVEIGSWLPLAIPSCLSFETPARDLILVDNAISRPAAGDSHNSLTQQQHLKLC
jgi:hypothetical protein